MLILWNNQFYWSLVSYVFTFVLLLYRYWYHCCSWRFSDIGHSFLFFSLIVLYLSCLINETCFNKFELWCLVLPSKVSLWLYLFFYDALCCCIVWRGGEASFFLLVFLSDCVNDGSISFQIFGCSKGKVQLFKRFCCKLWFELKLRSLYWNFEHWVFSYDKYGEECFFGPSHFFSSMLDICFFIVKDMHSLFGEWAWEFDEAWVCCPRLYFWCWLSFGKNKDVWFCLGATWKF